MAMTIRSASSPSRSNMVKAPSKLDAALAAVWSAAAEKRPLRGFEIDRAARQVIDAAGFGPQFVHRTGHSIDRDLHGSGPHCDDYETHDDRVLMPGVGFSVEPGIYLTGEFGIRSEVNVYWSADGPVLTPGEKRAVWRRITMESTAWRFNRYAERARQATGADHPDAASFADPVPSAARGRV